MSLHARQQLKHLSDISTLLARFESVDQTLPAVLSLMTRTLSVRGATLISNRSGRVLSTGWKAETTSPDRASRDEAHARTAYGYLTGTHSLGEKPDAAMTRARRTSRFSSKDLRAGMSADEHNNRLVLPLVVEGGPIFGALQVEGDVQLDESDLLFVNAVVQQLAVALDRQVVLASRTAVAEASRVHARLRIAELQRTERVEHFLADVSSLLTESLDYRHTLAAMVGAAVPFLADACFFDDITEAGKIVRIDERGVESLELAGSAPQPQAGVLTTGKAMILPDPSGKGGVRHELQAQVMSQSGFQSMIVVPLIVRGETLGALTLAVRGKKRRYGPKDLVLAEELARRAAIAIDHARLHRQTERAVRARENILNIVSHDLRGPLNALTLSASLLIEELTAAGGTATTHQALELLQRSVKRMDRMVGDLLDTASIDSGQLAITKDDHVLQAIVTEAVEGGMSAAARKSLRLEARLPQAKIRVTCDRGRIVQVLSNLIANAIKFTSPGGSIVVSVEPSETELRVAVHDTGTGIDRTHLPFVFDPYFRSRESVTTGTGLGLYISKGIIQSHGGALWVESEPGQGSTFTFSLPR